jgi:O-antigen ligase
VLSGRNVLEITKRAVPSFWTGGELINGPGLGSLASLGICLAPILFLGAREGMGGIKYYSFKITILFLVLIGSFANLALQNRGPFVALGISFIAALCVVFLFGKKSFYYVLKFAIALSLIVLLVWIIIPPDLLSKFTLFKRFAQRGLETTGRSTAWLLMLKGLFSSFTGGRFVDIHLTYVHNLWLDVAYETGIVPFILLLIFHGSHVSRFIKLFKSSLSLTMALMIICLFVSFLAIFFIEPALDFSPMYFATSCFFLGLVLRISEDFKKELDSSCGASTCV